LLFIVINKHLEWNYIQLIIGFFIAFDISGGMVCNSLNSCKRFYHSTLSKKEGKKEVIFKNHLLFSSFHIHPIIAWLIFDINYWIYGVIWYVIFMIAVIMVIRTPLYLKRPISMLLILIAIMLNCYIIAPLTGFEWLMPVLFIKIIYGHLVKEEPYRKVNKTYY